MKKKIVILGSTGSIGQSTLEVVKRDKKNFEIILLTANNNYKKIIQQAKEFKAKNVLIKNNKFFLKVKNSLKKNNTKVFSGDINLKKIIKKKVDYTMSSIVGLAGLQPTVDAIKISKTVAIANKETIICAWPILSKIIKKYKTKIVPVDSEHFSIMELTKNISDDEVEELIITASGGPFLNVSRNKFKKIKPSQATKHPNWKMGKKISVDSANLMNKVFEVIEAYHLFKFDKSKYKVMIHPQSYVHSIIRFRNGLTKMILYNADMKIPISNILCQSKNNPPKNSNINIIKKFNNISFQEVDSLKFPSIKLIKKCFTYGFSTPIIINAANEILVDLFLKGKIGFLDIVKTINKILKDKDFKKYAKRKPSSLKDIKITDKWARLKTKTMCVI
jgi:1-deoxy-D-xylulose-5-phosphate reductoisomerase